MTGMAAKQIANQFRDRALCGQNESGMTLVYDGPLAGENQEVSPVEGDEDAPLCRGIAQLIFVASSKMVGFLSGTAIDSPFAQHDGDEGMNVFVKVQLHATVGAGGR